jgi:predicted permease
MTLATLLDAAPILLLIALGVILRATGVVTNDSRFVLTRLAYYVTIPAAIFASVSRARLSAEVLVLPLIGFFLPILLAGLVYLTTRRLATRPQLRGVMMISMVVLGVFAYPFFELFFGAEGLARVAVYDAGNGLFLGTVALWLARAFSPARRGNPQRISLAQALASPILLAGVLGLVVSAAQLHVPDPLANFFDRLAAANTPVAMIAVGTFLRPQRSHGLLVGQVVLIRMVLGGLLGWAIGRAVGLDGLNLITATTASALPSGTTSLVYASNEGLDAEFAASVISFTVLIGVVLINILPLFLAKIYL